MALDPYSLCPCGNGKKLKFCECHAEAADIEKVLIAIEAEQRLQALEICNRVLAAKPTQKAMLGLKATVQLQMQDPEGAEKTIGEFLKADPNNPFALALTSIINVLHNRVDEAVTYLQKGLVASDNQIHAGILDAFHTVGAALDRNGKTIAARAHYGFHVAVSRERPSPAMRALVEIDRDADVSPFQKLDFNIKSAPEGAAFAAELAKANADYNQARWLAAMEQYEALDKKHPNQPVIVYNLAAMQSSLGKAQSPETWRRYSRLPGVSADDAVDAEAIAQEMAGEAWEDHVDVLRIIYKLKDAAKLTETLASEKRTPRANVDMNRMAREGEAPPRAVYMLLDRVPPAEDEPINLENVARVVGEFLVYGKETDRDARLEFIVARDAEMLARARLLQSVVGDQLGMIEKEEVIGKEPAEANATKQRWYTVQRDPKQLQELQATQIRRNFVDVLPTVKRKILDGRSMREVSADPAYRTRILALIARTQQSYLARLYADCSNEARQALGLPPETELDPTGVAMDEIPVVRLHRFDMAKTTDEQLADIYERVEYMGTAGLMKRVALEVASRPSMESRVEMHRVYSGLSSLFPVTSPEAIGYLDKARHAAVAKKHSPASFLLREFDLRLARNEPEEAQRVLRTLQTKHMNEPGVAETIYYRLASIGAIGPDGRPAVPAEAAAPAAASSGIWTPDQGSPAAPAAPAAQQQSASKLWIPGMD